MTRDTETERTMDLGTRNYLKRLIKRPSPFIESVEDSSDYITGYLLDKARVCVIGAGGLGCELLKNLALMGIRDIHVIDMDTIELSNLNRQFLFRTEDIGKSKAIVAAEYINRMVPDCKVVGHHKRIEQFDHKYYYSFTVLMCGLDSIDARRWINNLIVTFARYDEQGALIQSSVVPIIDGGTEGLKGNARVIVPGLTACIECNLDLYPPPINYPLCTIANTPRSPEHCIEYVKEILWDKELPFSSGVKVDAENPLHIGWIHEKAVERSKDYNIPAPTFRFTQGVVKRTIPAVSTTNACIAATCVMEAFKLITSNGALMNNYQIVNLNSGVYTYVFEADKDENCLVCRKNKC